MGGFLLLKKNECTRLEEVEEAHKDSINIFHKKGLKLSKKNCPKEFCHFSLS